VRALARKAFRILPPNDLGWKLVESSYWVPDCGRCLCARKTDTLMFLSLYTCLLAAPARLIWHRRLNFYVCDAARPSIFIRNA
jgi:hypothetical protein